MRRGKIVNIEDPAFLLDKNKGTCRVPATGDESYIEITRLKHKNLKAFEDNIFELSVGDKIVRIQKDELVAGLRYV